MADKNADRLAQKLLDKFKAYDKNGDGSITIDELRKAMISSGQTPTQDKLQRMIDQADEDGNGKIELEEFMSMLTRQREKAVAQKAGVQQAASTPSPMPASTTALATRGALEITLIGAMDLPNTDGGMGKSDPYCKVTMGGVELMRTKTVNNDLNPSWGMTKVVQWDGLNDIIFTVMDSDFFTKDDFMAQFILPKSKVCQGLMGTFPMQVPPNLAGRCSPQITIRIAVGSETGCCGSCSLM